MIYYVLETFGLTERQIPICRAKVNILILMQQCYIRAVEFIEEEIKWD